MADFAGGRAEGLMSPSALLCSARAGLWLGHDWERERGWGEWGGSQGVCFYRGERMLWRTVAGGTGQAHPRGHVRRCWRAARAGSRGGVGVLSRRQCSIVPLGALLPALCGGRRRAGGPARLLEDRWRWDAGIGQGG